MIHESQNESILAEWAFLEARKLLRANESKEGTHGEEENKNGNEKNGELKYKVEEGEMTKLTDAEQGGVCSVFNVNVMMCVWRLRA